MLIKIMPPGEYSVTNEKFDILPKTTTIDLTMSCHHATNHKSPHYLTCYTDM